MALVSEGLFLNVKLADQGGNTAALRLALNPAVTEYVDLETMGGASGAARITAVLADLAAVTKAKIIGYAVGESFAADDGKFGPLGAEVEENAMISSEIDGGLGKFATVRVPAPADTIFINNSAPGPRANEVDVVEATIQSWLKRFQATTGALTGDFTISDGESLVDVTSSTFTGKRIHRGSRKG